MSIVILPRAAWGAASPSRALTRFTNSRIGHVVTHWPGDARNLGGLDSAALLRSWQRFHMNGRGWRDIGYNYAVDHSGRIWEARGWHIGGHVLTTQADDQNARSVGVLLMVGNNEPMSDAMRDSGAALVDWIEARGARTLAYVGHCDWANKQCPGPSVLAWTRAGCQPSAHLANEPVATVPARTGEASPAPTFPLSRCRRHDSHMWYGPRSDLDHQVSGWTNTQANGTRGADGLERWQARMSYRGWRLTPDGLWGTQTGRVVRSFQTEKGLEGAGMIDAQTWQAAWASPIT